MDRLPDELLTQILSYLLRPTTADILALKNVYRRTPPAHRSPSSPISPVRTLPLVSRRFRSITPAISSTHLEFWCTRDALLYNRPQPQPFERRISSLVLSPNVDARETYLALVTCRRALTTINVSFEGLSPAHTIILLTLLRILRPRFVRLAAEPTAHLPLSDLTRMLVDWAGAGLEGLVYRGDWRKLGGVWEQLKGVGWVGLRVLQSKEDLVVLESALSAAGCELELDEVEPSLVEELVQWGRKLGDKANKVRWAMRVGGESVENGEYLGERRWRGFGEKDAKEAIREADEMLERERERRRAWELDEEEEDRDHYGHGDSVEPD